MNAGYLGSGWLALAAARRLGAAQPLVVAGPIAASLDGGATKETAAGLARRCDVVFLDLGSEAATADALFGADGIEASLASGTIVVVQSLGDPEATRAAAARLAQRGVVLVDAPIHCELASTMPEATAILCGGPEEAKAKVRPLLDAICPKVVDCGGVGNGHAMRIVTGAVATCNRLISYESAAIGLANGVPVTDLAHVITQSSGFNSATARVLPAAVEGRSSADAELGAAAEAIRLAARLARRTGAPMSIASLAGALVEGAAARHGASATLDSLSQIHEEGAGIRFAMKAAG